MSHYYFGASPWITVIGIVVIVLAVVGLFSIINGMIRAAKGELPVARGGSKPLAILEERYAAGEISRQEFENMRLDLLSEHH